MSTITARGGTNIYYNDWGSKPVVFSYGGPLSTSIETLQLPA